MSQRAQELIKILGLQPHPEGGWYREEFRSENKVAPADDRPTRSALTSIYFLLEAGQHSRWHRVLSDEVWVHLEGVALDLWTWDPINNMASCTVLGPVSATATPQHVVPAGLWQAARPQSAPEHDSSADHTLVACMVGPGFDFADFALMAPDSAEARTIRRDHPALASLV